VAGDFGAGSTGDAEISTAIGRLDATTRTVETTGDSVAASLEGCSASPFGLELGEPLATCLSEGSDDTGPPLAAGASAAGASGTVATAVYTASRGGTTS